MNYREWFDHHVRNGFVWFASKMESADPWYESRAYRKTNGFEGCCFWGNGALCSSVNIFPWIGGGQLKLWLLKMFLWPASNWLVLHYTTHRNLFADKDWIPCSFHHSCLPCRCWTDPLPILCDRSTVFSSVFLPLKEADCACSQRYPGDGPCSTVQSPLQPLVFSSFTTFSASCNRSIG